MDSLAIGQSLGVLGGAAALALAAMGSALGTGAAGLASIGAWKRCYAQDRTAPFMLAVFIGAPLTQTFYGFLLLLKFNTIAAAAATSFPALLGAGIFGGTAMGLSAWMQGRAGAGAADALAETCKGFGNYMIALGVIETVALFVMVFLMFFIK